MSDAHVRVTVVSDYICPWCYLGLARIERLQREFDIEVEWRPSELHPEIPEGGRDLSRSVAYYNRLLPVFVEAGLPFQPPVRVPNSRLALESAEFARERDAFESYHRALFDAYFAQGRDIGDIETLVEIAAASGLDARSLREAVASHAYSARVDELTDGTRALGVASTPTFVFECGERRFAQPGAQDYAVFENVAGRFGAVRRGTAIGTASKA
jgi:predicted DsbA family dithiol-disulfide isomerase